MLAGSSERPKVLVASNSINGHFVTRFLLIEIFYQGNDLVPALGRTESTHIIAELAHHMDCELFTLLILHNSDTV